MTQANLPDKDTLCRMLLAMNRTDAKGRPIALDARGMGCTEGVALALCQTGFLQWRKNKRRNGPFLYSVTGKGLAWCDANQPKEPQP